MEHKLIQRSNEELLIVFSPINIPKGRFGFSRFFTNEKRSVLFFNCENTWYVDCIQEIEKIVKSALDDLKPKNVVFYGASMGGYAAARIGGQYPQYPSYLFGPELELYIPGSLSDKNASIKQKNVDISDIDHLDFSNTVVLFGIYEPIDLKQYQISLNLGFYATIPVKSPHAVHEELYYRDLIGPLSQSSTCEDFLRNVPKNFIEKQQLEGFSEIFYELFFFAKHENQQRDIEFLKGIKHPSAYWILIKLALKWTDKELLRYVENELELYFSEFSEGFTMPEKFRRQISNVKKQI